MLYTELDSSVSGSHFALAPTFPYHRIRLHPILTGESVDATNKGHLAVSPRVLINKMSSVVSL